MEDKDKPRRVVHGFVHFEEHTQDDAAYSMEKAVKECAVFQEKIPQVFIHGKNTMPVLDVYQFKGHISSPLHSVFVATSWAETAFAAEWDKFKLPTLWTAVHGAAKGRVSTVDHFIDILHFGFAGTESIFNFFIMVCKNFLYDIH